MFLQSQLKITEEHLDKMVLTPEQIQDLKQQLKEQVRTLPEDKKAQALQQIDSLSTEALELMLKKQTSNVPEKGIFRMIVDNDIQSLKISENLSAIAVLDINPISQGHIIVIPKKPISDSKQMPVAAFTLAKKIANRLTSKLKAKSIEIQTETKFNESIISIIPSYTVQLNINSHRTKAEMKELEKVYFILKDKPKVERIKIKKTPNSKSGPLKLQKRIP